MSSFSQVPKRAIYSNRPIAVTFGDSITQQGFIVEKSGWVSMLADYWTRKVDVINRGYSGYNTRLGLRMVRDVVIPLNPAFVTVFFGANDACIEGTLHHVPLQEYISNMDAIVTILKQELPSSTIILITPPPVDETTLIEMNRQKGKSILKDRNQENTRRYVDAVKDLGQKYGLSVIDLFSVLHGNIDVNAAADSSVEMPKDFLSDGLHLNERGNRALFHSLVNEITTKYPDQWNTARMDMDQPGWSDALMSLQH